MIEQVTVRKVIPGREKFYKCFRFIIRKHNLEYTFCKFKLLKINIVMSQKAIQWNFLLKREFHLSKKKQKKKKKKVSLKDILLER